QPGTVLSLRLQWSLIGPALLRSDQKTIMRKSIVSAPIIFTSILFLCAIVAAQNTKSTAKPDFSGTWLLDTKKSNTGGLTMRPDLPMTISHQDPEFKMVIASESNGQITKHEF